MPRKIILIGLGAFEIFFMYSPYSVISVLNAFQAAIVLRSMQYLRLIVYALDGDDEKDEKRSCLDL